MIRNSSTQVSRYYLTGKYIGKIVVNEVFEWLVSLVGSRIYVIIELEAKESKKSLAG